MPIEFTGTYTDLYQIAMGQAMFRDGLHLRPATFDYFFRRTPFGGGYSVFAGLEPLLDALEDWHFSAAEIDYLGSHGFEPAYLEFLRGLRFGGSIHAPAEGEPVFPTEPVLRVTGWDTVVPLKRAEHHYLPTVSRIVAGVRRVLEA